MSKKHPGFFDPKHSKDWETIVMSGSEDEAKAAWERISSALPENHPSKGAVAASPKSGVGKSLGKWLKKNPLLR
jgi:hypothetical protein